MARYAYDEPTPEFACERCEEELTERHWARLIAKHQGELADRYAEGERRICVDCVAALGLLEFAGKRTETTESPSNHDRREFRQAGSGSD